VANYQRSLSINQYQPEVAARVAALQASGVPMPASPLVNPTPGTRTADQWQSSVRY
jgi:hypothetical protein